MLTLKQEFGHFFLEKTKNLDTIWAKNYNYDLKRPNFDKFWLKNKNLDTFSSLRLKFLRLSDKKKLQFWPWTTKFWPNNKNFDSFS